MTSPQAATPEPSWRVSDPAALLRRHFEDGTVVFDRRSGLTHQLDPFAAEALELLTATALTRRELAGRMADLLDAPSAASAIGDRCALVLMRLAALGLVEPTAP